MTDQIAKPEPEPSRLETTGELGSSADRLLSLSEERYRSLIGAMAAIVWTTTPEGKQVNNIPEWQEFTGKTREEVAGFGWAEAIHPEDRERTERLWGEALEAGSTFELEHRLRRHDGVYRIMQVRAVPVRDASGEIVEWVGMHSDVTEQRDLELALQRREMELREAHRIAHLGSWWWDVESDTVSWSDVVYQIFERSPDLLPPTYEELAKYHTEESWARLNSAVGQALALGKSYELDVEIQVGSGQRKWVAARGEVEAYANGKVARLRGTIQDVSERKARLFEAQAAEAAIRESEERLRVAAEAAMFGTFDTDMVNRTGYWSREMRELVGYPLDGPPPPPLGVPAFVHPEDADQVGQSLQRAIAGPDGQLVDEHRILRPDGTVRWMQLRGQVRFEGEGKDRRPVRFSGTIFDITERKRTESALRKSEERFRKLFESDLLGIGTPHRSGGFDEVNDEFLRIVGYTREDFEAGLVRWDSMTPPEFTATDMEHVAEAMRRGSCTPYEKEYIRKDGGRVPILCGYASMETFPEHFIGFIQDLSVQKRTEVALRDREQRFSVLAESLPSLIFVTEHGGSFSYCNGRFLEYGGYSGEDLPRIRWENFIHADDLMATVEVWRRCVETADPFLKEHRLRRHDGVYRWFLSRAMPVRDEQGQVVRWFGSSTEIHEQKLAEQALRRSDKLAAMGRLAASVAHEINNPLTSVTNALYLARIDPTLSESTRGFLELADQELVRVAQVATQTLRFYKQSTAPAVVDVSQILEQVVQIFAARLRSLSVEVDREYGEDCTLYCFGDELRQVFANLIGNALDAMVGGGRLRIRVHRAVGWKEEGRRGVRVLVGDTGSGIPVEVLHQIFEPFVSTKADTGTGLGLWVSDGIVRKHRGRIRVRSCCEAPRQGTVFSIFLPLDGVESGSPPS
jgi:PAS domain S-box-containing protein